MRIWRSAEALSGNGGNNGGTWKIITSDFSYLQYPYGLFSGGLQEASGSSHLWSQRQRTLNLVTGKILKPAENILHLLLAHTPVCSCPGILPSHPHLPADKEVWEAWLLAFLPCSFWGSFEGRGWCWESTNDIYHRWIDVTLSLSPIFKLMACFFSTPAIQVSWKWTFRL